MTQELPEGTVTIRFTDVEGSTDLTTRRGDDVAHAILRAQRELVRQQVGQHSGCEVKSLGDGFMVAFASARKAVACAVGIQQALEQHNRQHPDQQVQVRIGLNTGEAIQEEADLFGEAVNAAARIAAKAKGSQILLSEAVRGVLGRAKDVELVDRGRFRLKGFPERWRLYEVVWQEEAPAAASALPERTPFVGREAEQAELRRSLGQAARGRGALVMIGGEPGVGKTRLAEELLLEARQRGVLSLTGHCYEMEGAPPYMPFVETLEATARIVRRVAERGYPVRAIIMPIIPIEGWQDAYTGFTDRLLQTVAIRRLTLGGICIYRSARDLMERKMGMRNVVPQHLDATSPKAGDGRARYSRDLRHEVYSLIVEAARRLRPDLEIALCLEEQALWESTGLVENMGRCNCRL